MCIWKKSYFALLLIIVLLLAGCVKEKQLPEDTKNSAESIETRTKDATRKPFLVQQRETILVYFVTLDGKNLVPVTLTINPTKEAAKIAVEKLLAGPENNLSLRTIPEGTKLREIYIQDRTVYVDLTKEIKNVSLDQIKTKLAVESLVLILTDFKEVDDVQILIEGQIEKKLGEVAIDKPLKRSSDINYYGGQGNKKITVFYGDSNGVYLVPVTIQVSDKDLPLAALRKLIGSPPAGSGLERTCWPGTRIKSFSVRDGIATVNFNSKVLDYGGGTSAENILVNSIVYTLTQFENIKAVQFLIEGKILEYLPEGTDISLPIYAPRKINFSQ